MSNPIFSARTADLSGSAIRATFKLLADPAIISFAGGAPSPSVFPKQELADIAAEILAKNGAVALQYGITEGYAPLADFVKKRLIAQGIIKEEDAVLLTTGGQQVIDLAAKCLLDEGDVVAVERPSFVGGLNSFRSYNAILKDVPVLGDGLDVDYLEEEILKKQSIKLLYTIPTFQNPSGITMSLEKRKRLLALASQYNFYILEDNPYGELRYRGEIVPTMKSMDTEHRVIYAGSFSKILSPGMRIGFTSAPTEILDKMVVCKQVSDVHTPMLTQMIAYEYVTRYSLDEHIQMCCDVFREKNELMLRTMDASFPDWCSYTRPDGGLFIWCTMPDGYDGQALFMKAVERKVAFVSGLACMADQTKIYPNFRLNFSATANDKIVEGIEILADVLHTEGKSR